MRRSVLACSGKRKFLLGKRVLVTILMQAMLLSMLPTSFSFVSMAGAEVPISDRNGLESISGSGSYRLTADINLEGDDWIPLENFSGTLNGDGHVIRNLSITDTTELNGNNKGLFASISETGKVFDLGIVYTNITAYDNVGALTGNNYGKISRCYTIGTVSGENNVGGIAGINNGTIEDCYSKVAVSGKNFLGGLTGNNNGTIETSYAASTVMDLVMSNYLQFNAIYGERGGWIEIPHNSEYNGSAFTLEAWFQCDEVDTDVVRFIIGKGVERFEIHTGGGSGKNGIRFIPVPSAHNDRPYRGGYEGDSYIDVHNVLQPGWFHVAAVYSYDNDTQRANTQVYVNGEAQDLWQIPSSGREAINVGETATISRTSNPLSDSNNNANINIGRRTDRSYYFDGKIADVRFWNTARTEEQIKDNKDKVLDGTESGLVGYWRLNESTEDNLAIDSSSTINNGYLCGNVSHVVSDGEADHKGGLVGSNSGTVTECYYDSSLCGLESNIEGTAKSTIEMKSEDTYRNWDLSEVWKIKADNYPQLRTSASVNVSNGTADKTIAEEGETITIMADEPPAGQQFKEWTITPDVTFLDSTSKTSETAKFAMPSRAVTAEAVYEIIPPTVKIEVSTASWRELLNDITFNIFYMDTQTVTITAGDTGLGEKTVYYYTSDQILTLDEVKALSDSDDWITGSSFSIEPNEKVVIYAKVVDQEGNVAYASSQGIVLDNVAPTITGIMNGGTYARTQYFAVSDLYLKDSDAVTIDGEITIAETTGEHVGFYRLSPKDRGSHTIVVTDKAGNKTTYTTTVLREEVTVPVIASKTYNEQTQSAEIAASELYEELTNEGGTSVGTYEVVLALTDTKNTEWKAAVGSDTYVVDKANGTVTTTFEIIKADNSFTQELSCADITYTGSTAASASATSAFGTPVYTYYKDRECTEETSTNDGATVDGGAPKDVGTYYVKASVIGTDNYTELTSEAVSFTIAPASRNKPELTFQNETYKYQSNGVISGVTSAMEYTTDQSGTWTKITSAQDSTGKLENLAVGTYYIRYVADKNHTAGEYETITIGEGISIEIDFLADGCDTSTLSMQTVEVAYNGTISEATTPKMPSVPEKTGYDIKGWKLSGTADSQLVTSITDIQAPAIYVAVYAPKKFTITLPTGTTGYTVSAEATSTSPVEYDGNYSFTVNLASGYSKTDDFKVYINKGTASETILTPTMEGGNTYMVNHIGENKMITVEGIEDITAPTGEIKVGATDSNKWSSFLNTITFGLFFKNTQMVEVTAEDTDGSGVESIKYYVSETKLTNIAGSTAEGDVNSYDINWRTYSDGFSVDPNKKVIIYVKITDNATNVTYISSDGLVLDNVAPVISGVENNGTYAGTTEITITDDFLEDYGIVVQNDGNTVEVTRDGNGKFTLPPDENLYCITVTDKAGNVTGPISFRISRNTVTVPEISAKSYSGSGLTADVTSNAFYTVTDNTGGIDVGTYNVVLTLTDRTNYEWRTDSTRTDYTINREDGTVSVIFNVTKADNTFIETITCEGFAYSGNAVSASAMSAFGTPVYTYYTDEDCTRKTSTDDGASVDGGAPKNVGNYYVKAYVAGTDNYTALTSSTFNFAISLANRAAPEVGHTDVSYTGQTDGIISGIKTGMEWTTTPYDASSWEQVTTIQISSGMIVALAAGTYYFRLRADRNHNISAVATVVIDTKIKLPVKVLISPPIYNADNQNEVTVKGTVTKGEYEVTAQSFSYRKEGSSTWTAIPTIGTEVTLVGLSANTIYELKLTATDNHGNEAIDTKKFKTLQSSKETGQILGSVDGDSNKRFSVSIKSGSTTLCTRTGLSKGDTFTFTNLIDGEYNLEVTDGEYKVTIMVTVKNGSSENLGVIKVTEKQTVVEVEAGAPNVAVDGLNDVFDASIVKDSNDVKDALDNGGTIEIRLTASETTIQENIAKLKKQANVNRKQIGMLTDLNVDMIVTSLNGESIKSSIIDTEKMLLIAIPLTKSARGKNGYQAYRVHNGETQTLTRLDSSERLNPTKEGFYVDENYLYVCVRYFSSYALAYNKATDPSELTSPIVPADPIASVDQSVPTYPIVLTDSTKPTDTSSLTDSTKPTDTSSLTDSKKPKDTTEVARSEDSSDSEESQKDREVKQINKDNSQEKTNNPINHKCYYHWYMLLLMLGYVLFVLLGKNKPMSLMAAVFTADVILTIILVVVGSCKADIPFAVGTLIIAGASVLIKRWLKRWQAPLTKS